MKQIDLEEIPGFPQPYINKLNALGVMHVLQFLGMCYAKDTFGVLAMYLELPRAELHEWVKEAENFYSEEEIQELRTPVPEYSTGAIVED